jgi:hypothetical protein
MSGKEVQRLSTHHTCVSVCVSVYDDMMMCVLK